MSKICYIENKFKRVIFRTNVVYVYTLFSTTSVNLTNLPPKKRFWIATLNLNFFKLLIIFTLIHLLLLLLFD